LFSILKNSSISDSRDSLSLVFMKSVADRIMDRVRVRGRGNGVFTPTDFLVLGSRVAIDRALSRLVVAGKLRRIGRGLYDFPRHSEILKGDVPANLDATVQAISRRDKVRVMPNGIVFANNLGLTNAVPAKASYISSGRTKTVQVDGRRIYLKHVGRKVIAWADRPGGQFVAAVLWLGKPIASSQDVINLLRARLADDVKQELLRDLELLPAWMASIAKRVCDNSSIAIQISSSSKI
jgi:Family of unknown function (DUF6088)